MFAKDYAKPGKNIDDCCDFIISEVKKSGRQGFDDDEIYGIAIHYYNEEEVSFTKNQNCTIVTNLSDQTKENLEKKAEEEFKQAKIIELQKKESAEKERLKKKAELPHTFCQGKRAAYGDNRGKLSRCYRCSMPGPRKHQFRFSRYHSEAYQR